MRNSIIKWVLALVLFCILLIIFCKTAYTEPIEYVYGSRPEELDRFYMEGLATWYHHPGRLTRNEELYQTYSPTCAVDDHLWPYLEGKLLRITNLETGEWLVLRVNDTGYLHDAHLGVVVDLPKGTHRFLSGDGDTFRASVIIIEESETYPLGADGNYYSNSDGL